MLQFVTRPNTDTKINVIRTVTYDETSSPTGDGGEMGELLPSPMGWSGEGGGRGAVKMGGNLRGGGGQRNMKRLTVDNRGVKQVAVTATIAVRNGCSIGNCQRDCAPVMRHDSAAFESNNPRLRLSTGSTIFLQWDTGWRELLRLLAALHRCGE